MKLVLALFLFSSVAFAQAYVEGFLKVLILISDGSDNQSEASLELRTQYRIVIARPADYAGKKGA